MLINGRRALAYVVTVDELKPIAGYDRVEYARTKGWWVIVSKDYHLRVGDKCVYFEIDSKVPEDDSRFAFLADRHYRIRTLKMCKVISQGLLMPLTFFPELKNAKVNTDVTKKLRITYAVQEDNSRKEDISFKAMEKRHRRLFGNQFIQFLMTKKWGRNLLFRLFGKEEDKVLAFPEFIQKTDEERVENQPYRVGDGKTYILTEKLDGTSCTYVLLRKAKGETEFMVCSRNRRLSPAASKDYKEENIYWELAKKYHIENCLKEYLSKYSGVNWVCLQGEGVGAVQGNPLKLTENDLYLFNFIDSKNGRFGTYQGKEITAAWGMKWVPILGEGQTQATMEELKKFADGKSVVNPSVLREGIVYRSPDGKDSFKNVSAKYLLKGKKEC